jgi:hypothetical protein
MASLMGKKLLRTGLEMRSKLTTRALRESFYSAITNPNNSADHIFRTERRYSFIEGSLNTTIPGF